MTAHVRAPVSLREALILSGFYGVILVVSVKLGYALGMVLLALGLAVNYRVMARLLKTYLWDQWRVINAETMERRFLGPEGSGAGAGKGGAGKGGLGTADAGEADASDQGGKGGKAGKGAKAAKKTGKRRQKGAEAPRLAGAGPAPVDLAPGWRLDWRPLVILVFAAIVLTLLEYYGSRRTYVELFPKFFPYQEGYGFRELGVSVFGTKYQRFGEYVYWVGFRVGAFFLLPALLILWLPGERLRDYGLSTKGFFKHLWIYGVLFAIVLPAVIAVSFTDAFASHYPFYKPWKSATFPRELFLHDFLAWEAMYAMQFFSLEFFFRGFLLHALKRSMGAYAIFVMALPYCMIHFGKPMPETLGAVAAGIVLGTLALRTGSIWAGVMIHVSVAWSMDTLALLQTGRWPKIW